jgi:hypothetical protein
MHGMAFLEFKPTQTVYKFCSSDGFLGIIKSKLLWFSDLASANDPREIKLGYEHFVQALDLVRRENLEDKQGDFLSILSEHLDRVHTSQQAFCCCFSLVADALPMWNEYGGNYGGLAIGFRPTALFDIPCRIQKVKYLKSETIDEFKSFVLSLSAQFDVKHAADDLIYWVRATSGSLAAMTALKHMTWSHEQEVRLVYAQMKQPPTSEDGSLSIPISKWPDGKLINWTKPLVRSNGTHNLEYLEFPFGKFRDGAFSPERAIKSIIIGPKCMLSRSDVTSMMQKNGFKDFEVIASACQIR